MTNPTNQPEEISAESASSLSESIAAALKERTDAAGDAARRKQLAEAAKDSGETLWLEWGPRYKLCRFENFKRWCPEQDKVVEQLQQYAANMDHLIERGAGIVLTGKPGRGKDHLLAAMAHLVLEKKRYTMKWTSGNRLWSRFRDDIRTEVSERTTNNEFVRPRILVISDPAWDGVRLTEQQKRRLGEIVDDRVNRLRPIWMSINTSGLQDAQSLLGKALVDRLKDRSLSLACDGPKWDSYRKSARSVAELLEITKR